MLLVFWFRWRVFFKSSTRTNLFARISYPRKKFEYGPRFFIVATSARNLRNQCFLRRSMFLLRFSSAEDSVQPITEITSACFIHVSEDMEPAISHGCWGWIGYISFFLRRQTRWDVYPNLKRRSRRSFSRMEDELKTGSHSWTIQLENPLVFCTCSSFIQWKLSWL